MASSSFRFELSRPQADLLLQCVDYYAAACRRRSSDRDPALAEVFGARYAQVQALVAVLRQLELPNA